MQKKKAARLAGFIGALCASGTLVGLAVSGTGAYFTDSSNGTIRANSGALTIDTTDPNLNFANLMPGAPQQKNVGYTTHVSSGKVDVWLTFDPTSVAYKSFTGARNDSTYPDGGLGRFGYFAVSNNNNLQFRSHNLQLPANGTNPCANQYGDGGSDQAATSVADTPPECGVPDAIRLATGLSDGSQGEVEMVFGLSGRQTEQNQVEFAAASGQLPFKIVATQAGKAPNDPNF